MILGAILRLPMPHLHPFEPGRLGQAPVVEGWIDAVKRMFPPQVIRSRVEKACRRHEENEKQRNALHDKRQVRGIGIYQSAEVPGIPIAEEAKDLHYQR